MKMRQRKNGLGANTTAAPAGSIRPLPAWALGSILHLVLIVVTGTLVYSNTFGVPFTFDDNHSIIDNPVIKDLSTFLSGAGYAYNPRRFVGILTIALNYHVGGLSVTGYHLVNLAIHLGNALLVYALVRLTFRAPFFKPTTGEPTAAPRLVSLFAALLFVAHPVQTQAVTYVIQRLASLATLFYLAAVICYAKARIVMVEGGSSDDSGRAVRGAGWFLLCLLAIICAMRTKEIAATLPLTIVLYEFSFFGAHRGKRLLLLLLPVLLTLLVVPIGILVAGKPAAELLSDVSSLTRETQNISRGGYLLTQFCVIATYLRLLFLPIAQNLDYDYPVYHSLFAPRVLSSFLLLSGLIALALVLYRKSADGGACGVGADRQPVGTSAQTRQAYRLIAFGIVWFFLTLSVESSIIPIKDVIFEHRVYLPSFGAFIAFAAAASLLARRVPRQAAFAAGACIVLALGVATFARNEIWGDQLVLWRDVLEKSPGKARPYNNVGLLLKERGDVDGALRCFQRAVELQPDFDAYDNLGVTLYLRGLTGEALKSLEHARELNPNSPHVYINVGKIYLDSGDLPRAIVEFEKALALAPDAPVALNNIASAHLKLRQYDKAIAYLREGEHVNPDDLTVRYNLAAALYLKGAPEQALRELERVLRADPEHQAAKELVRTITGR